MLSLRSRINLILASSTAFVAITATLVFSGFFIEQQRLGLEAKARALANLTGAQLAPALDFDDRETVLEAMSSLSQDPDFTYAIALKKDGSMFAGLGNVPEGELLREIAGEKTLVLERQDEMHVAAPLFSRNERLGAVHLGFSMKQIKASSLRIRVLGLALCLGLVVLVTGYLSFAIGRAVIKPVEQMTDAVERLGQGDFRVYDSDSAGRNTREIALMDLALKRATETFREHLMSIKNASSELELVANDILASSHQLSNAAGSHAGNASMARETTARVERSSKQSHESAVDIVGVSKHSIKISSMGLMAVEGSLAQFRSVREQIDAIVEAGNKLEEQLGQVDSVIESLANISALSQILSINASIEAASGGETGLGFSVIAREMKQLSSQSEEATGGARKVLELIRQRVVEVMSGSKVGSQRAEKGILDIENTGQVIKRLSDVIEDVSKAAHKISTNIYSQVESLADMTKAMSGIEDQSEENLAAARALEKRGEELKKKAKEMAELVSRFRI